MPRVLIFPGRGGRCCDLPPPPPPANDDDVDDDDEDVEDVALSMSIGSNMYRCFDSKAEEEEFKLVVRVMFVVLLVSSMQTSQK